ncbi:hypothetical protein PG988_006605 [Apiospora saccharicola]
MLPMHNPGPFGRLSAFETAQKQEIVLLEVRRCPTVLDQLRARCSSSSKQEEKKKKQQDNNNNNNSSISSRISSSISSSSSSNDDAKKNMTVAHLNPVNASLLSNFCRFKPCPGGL